MTKEFEKSLAPWLGKTMKCVENKIEERLEENGLDISKMQFLLLRSVYQKEGICQNELAFFSNRNKSSLTRAINTLEKKNYIARMASKEDRRINQLFITKQGLQMLEKAKPLFLDMAALIESGLSKEEIEATINTLKKIQKNVAGKEIGYLLNNEL
ncbi:MAG: MarR family winged helix-turn-helix transcriptional regulator [Crocinitomicaceae bacterium]